MATTAISPAQPTPDPPFDSIESMEEDEDDDEELGDLPNLGPPPGFHSGTKRVSVRSSFTSDMAAGKNFTPVVHQKSAEDKEKLKTAMSKLFLFEHLEGEQLTQVLDAFEPKAVPSGTVIIKQGDNNVNNVRHLYIVGHGQCNVTKASAPGGEEQHVLTVRQSDCFGELALMYNCPRAATVTAAEDTGLFALDRDTFQFIVQSSFMRKRKVYEEFMTRVPALAGLSTEERNKVIDVLKKRTYSDGSKIIEEGDTKADTFFILYQGKAIATKASVGIVKEYTDGDCFGELALIKDQPRAATVEALGDCHCVTIDRASFTRLIGPYEGLLERVLWAGQAGDQDTPSKPEDGTDEEELRRVKMELAQARAEVDRRVLEERMKAEKEVNRIKAEHAQEIRRLQEGGQRSRACVIS